MELCFFFSQLGASIMSRRTARTTHVLLGNGVNRSSVPHRIIPWSSTPDGSSTGTDLSPVEVDCEPSLNSTEHGAAESVPSVVVVDESWLLRHVRAAAAKCECPAENNEAEGRVQKRPKEK